jgi:hypothetical protein
LKVILNIIQKQKKNLIQQTKNTYQSEILKSYIDTHKHKNQRKSNESEATNENDQNQISKFNISDFNFNSKLQNKYNSLQNEMINIKTNNKNHKSNQSFRRSKRLMKKKKQLNYSISLKSENEINGEFDQNENSNRSENFVTEVKDDDEIFSEKSQKSFDDLSIFSDPEPELAVTTKRRSYRHSLKKKRETLPKNPKINQSSKEEISYINIRKIKKGTFLYKKFSKYFSLPLEEVIHNDDIFDDISEKKSSKERCADLENLKKPSGFSSYYGNRQKNFKFKIDITDEEKTEKELKSFKKKLRKNGKIALSIKQNFNIICDQQEIKELKLKFKGVKRLKKQIEDKNEDLGKFLNQMNQ